MLRIHPGTIDAYLTSRASGYTEVNDNDLLTSQTVKTNPWSLLLNIVLLEADTCMAAILLGGVFTFLITRINLAWCEYLSPIFIFPYIVPQ